LYQCIVQVSPMKFTSDLQLPCVHSQTHGFQAQHRDHSLALSWYQCSSVLFCDCIHCACYCIHCDCLLFLSWS
jgi:hypothetical protein